MPINKEMILVVGGAGFIGSHMLLTLKQAGFLPIVLDNLSKGHKASVGNVELIIGDMADKNLLREIFSRYAIMAVMHFGSYIEVAESIKFPQKYYQNNLLATVNLLDVMMERGIKHFIFSSTAAVYGEPHYAPIDEVHPIAPLNPYGRSKWMVEEIIKDYAKSAGLNYAILRYFNAAGADPYGRLGECHSPESHLIPLILQTASGLRDAIHIYGNDYATADGTCIRDYVHVTDLCEAHLLALKKMLAGKNKLLCNLGSECGYSVLEVINMAKKISQCAIPILQCERRLGDSAILVANATLAKKELEWKPRYSELEIIIKHAWQFMSKPCFA